MIEPTGPESPPSTAVTSTRRQGLGQFLAVDLTAAVVAGAVAAGVTLAVYRQQARTNPQDLNLGTNVTISEENSAQLVASKALPTVASVVTAEDGGRFGSGFLVTSDGFMLTNTAVVANATVLTVVLAGDTKRHDARLVDYDCRAGFAVLKVDQVSGLPTLPFGDSNALKPGQTVIALGGPLEPRAIVTRGVVTALHRRALISGPVNQAVESAYSDTIQTDAAISHGSSGGPLLNVGGQVVGVNMAAGSSAETTGFALSSNRLQTGVQQIIQTGRLQIAGLGVEVTDLSPEEAAVKGLPAGSLITRLTKGGPAEQAGLHSGDLITQLDATKVDATHPLDQVLQAEFRPTQRVQVSYARSGSSSQVQLTLQSERPTCL